ncbi:UbiX family flavin prenyltransferase [Streptomyces sp. CBMA29]|uniref:UbiX family flavin prenyltransferase n=1 Tax=Streptomyces sp. CBMA29 TaxID=1896314 RepID=UPI0016619B31|nr:UbiX family flavin prenyltransferase [Streptomyces sp. CBMA29]MBD0738128.1 aromatic acid decarboxylase [Streptomyces sp. CBMA29]
MDHHITPRVPWVVGITGASGTPYAAAVIRGLLDAGEAVDLVVSRAARLTMVDETGQSFREARWRTDMKAFLGRDPGDMTVWRADDFAAGPASGTYPTRGMVIVPATTAAVAGVATGMSKDLIQRAADVTLKERRPLVMVVRETPLRRVSLQQMADLAGEGAVILPASPGFYAGARDVRQLVDFVAAKVLDVIRVPHTLSVRWSGRLGAGRDADAFADDPYDPDPDPAGAAAADAEPGPRPQGEARTGA